MNDLTKGSPLKLIVMFTIPLVIGYLVQQVQHFRYVGCWTNLGCDVIGGRGSDGCDSILGNGFRTRV